MAKVIWSEEALTNIDAIELHIAQFSPKASHRFGQSLKAAANALDRFPERGRPVGNGTRVLFSVPPYVIRYKLLNDGVVLILRVRHAAQRRR